MCDRCFENKSPDSRKKSIFRLILGWDLEVLDVLAYAIS